MKPTKEQLNGYLGKKVQATFYDGYVIIGKLCFADEFSAKHDWRMPNYYYIGQFSFKVSHLKKICLIGG